MSRFQTNFSVNSNKNLETVNSIPRMSTIYNSNRNGITKTDARTGKSRMTPLRSTKSLRSTPARLKSNNKITPIPSTLSMKNEYDNDEIEMILKENKFTPLNRIMTKNGRDEINGKFIKVRSPSGAIALVDVNIDGVMAVTSEDIITTQMENSKALDIPLNLKIGSLDSIGNNVPGVAFECVNGICTIMKDGNMRPEEKNFVKVSEIVEEQSIIDSSPFSIPIVRLSEIMANPRNVDRKITNAVNRIFEASYIKCKEDVIIMEHSIIRLSEEFKKIVTNLDVAFKNTKSTIQKLNIYNDEFNRHNHTDTNEILRHEKVVDELSARYELYQNLINICSVTHNNIYNIDTVANNMNQINEIIRKDFSYLNKKITEPVITNN